MRLLCFFIRKNLEGESYIMPQFYKIFISDNTQLTERVYRELNIVSKIEYSNTIIEIIIKRQRKDNKDRVRFRLNALGVTSILLIHTIDTTRVITQDTIHSRTGVLRNRIRKNISKYM